MEHRHKSYERIGDAANVRHLVDTSAKEIAALGKAAHQLEYEQKYAIDRLDAVTSERFLYLGRASRYVDSMAKLLSADDWQSTGQNPNTPLEMLSIGSSGDVFRLAAQFTFIQREKQLREDFGFRRANPKYQLTGYRFFTKPMMAYHVREAVDLADDFRNLADRAVRRPGLSWRQLTDYLTQTIDLERTHGREVALGVIFGNILVRSAYGSKIDRHNHSVERRITSRLSSISKEFSTIPSISNEEMEEYFKDD